MKRRRNRASHRLYVRPSGTAALQDPLAVPVATIFRARLPPVRSTDMRFGPSFSFVVVLAGSEESKGVPHPSIVDILMMP